MSNKLKSIDAIMQEMDNDDQILESDEIFFQKWHKLESFFINETDQEAFEKYLRETKPQK